MYIKAAQFLTGTQSWFISRGCSRYMVKFANFLHTSSRVALQDSMVQQALSLLNTALMHVELAERVLNGWEATETLPLIIARADDRAEAAAAVARDLLHTLHTGVVSDACPCG
jgi:hypothetical protein